MRRRKPVPWRLALAVVAAIVWWSGPLAESALAQVIKEDSPAARANFTGSMTVRQAGGTLYYKIFVLRGKVIGGYDTWKGSRAQYHRIVGGWYDGKRLALLIQSTRSDVMDKWHSHAHHFNRDGDSLSLDHTLYGFGKTMNEEVYRPHLIEEAMPLSAEEVERLSKSNSVEDDIAAKEQNDADRDQLADDVKRLQQQNVVLKLKVTTLEAEMERLRRQLDDERRRPTSSQDRDGKAEN